MALLHIGAGGMLALATWVALRRMVGARHLGRLDILLLDLLPIALGFLLFLLATARPIAAGLGVAALGIGLAVADRIKRAVLHEPVMFADRAELWEVARHPRFYIAFVGTVPMLAGTAALVALAAVLIWAEPPLWRLPPGTTIGLLLLAVALGRAAFVLPTMPCWLRRSARWFDRLAPSRDPAIDAARFGLLASFIIQATLARHERPARRQRAIDRALPSWPKGAGPVILVQGESFVDVGRLHPALSGRLPHFARLAADAQLSGTLAVPCWGANTIRTECAVLTGLDEDALGLDCFNPYEAFARTGLPSLAWQARAAGYRTICVHPYARSFYGRDAVMPALGFDRFIGIEAFSDAERDSGYVTDAALAQFVVELVAREGPDIFVFAITVENHGPWDAAHDAVPPAPLPQALAEGSGAKPLGRWLRHACATDAMIPPLRAVLEQVGRGWLGVYGDHQPSLELFDREDRRTDYALWSASGGPGAFRAAAADELPLLLLGLMQGSQ